MKKLTVNPEFKKLIPPLSVEEYNQLTENIISDGCLEPIVTWNETIVDGHNRYEICSENGVEFKTRAMAFDSELHAKVWMIKNQAGRRNLSDGWRVQLELSKKAYLAEIGREKQERKPANSVLSNNDKTKVPHNTRNELAKAAGVSAGKLAQAEIIMRKAPEKWEKVKADEMTIGGAYAEIKKEERIDRRTKEIEAVKEKIKNDPKSISGLFGVIAIDPPWPYGRKYDPETSRVANPYPEMELDDIGKISLPCEKDCVLFLWTTHAFLKQSFDLMEKWGFKYKATLVWDKEKMGMGATVRMQCEFCLLGVMGSPLISGSAERDIIREARREHSRKPESFYKMVERMTVGRRLDYFSREEKEGWVSYGAESSMF